MSRRQRNVWAGLLAVGCLAAAVAFLPAMLQGEDARPVAASESQDRLIVHEWGTFTSFSGSDGVQLEYRPLVTNDLPRFVFNPYSEGNKDNLFLLVKDRYVAFQRMETPVTYFYTDKRRTVNVRVDFPEGMLSEWFPTTKEFNSGEPTDDRTMGGAFLDWGDVRLTPADEFADVRVRNPKGDPQPASLPPVSERHHYGRARETDSAVVETVDKRGGSYFEKFLFYRGLGDFALPIQLVGLGSGRFEVVNSGDEASGGVVLVQIRNDRLWFKRSGPVDPHSTVELALPSEESSVDALAATIVEELTAAGLYEKEALAMVNTWRSSWFGENGTRLLYLVPGDSTDELLPLTVTPTPDETVRVLVGRLETLTPEDGHRLTQSLTGGETAPSIEAAQAALAPLGRFAEPAVRSLINQAPDELTRSRLEHVQFSLYCQE